MVTSQLGNATPRQKIKKRKLEDTTKLVVPLCFDFSPYEASVYDRSHGNFVGLCKIAISGLSGQTTLLLLIIGFVIDLLRKYRGSVKFMVWQILFCSRSDTIAPKRNS